MSFIFSILASLIAGIFLPTLVRFLNNLKDHLFIECPNVQGDWVATFNQPDGTTRTLEICLHRFGKVVHGTGHITGQSNDPFFFKGILKQQSLAGDFWRSRSRVLAGTGAFLLKIAADEKTMSGSCSWYDTNTDNVWNSKYEWEQRH